MNKWKRRITLSYNLLLVHNVRIFNFYFVNNIIGKNEDNRGIMTSALMEVTEAEGLTEEPEGEWGTEEVGDAGGGEEEYESKYGEGGDNSDVEEDGEDEQMEEEDNS